jgi:hypothetical protein
MSRRKKWFLRFAVLFVIVAIPIGLWTVALFSVGSGFSSTRAKLDATDPGWRYPDIVAAYNASLPPDEENSIFVVRKIPRELPPSYKNLELQYNLEKWLPYPEMNRKPWPEQLKKAEAVWGDLEPALKLAHKLESMPRGGLPQVVAANPQTTLAPQWQEGREVATLLRFDALMSAQAGQPEQAMADIRGGLHAARAVGNEPYLMCLLLRIACMDIMLDALERSLAWCEPKEELVKLHQLLLQEHDTPILKTGIRGERAVYDALFEFIAQNPGWIRQNVRLAGGAGNSPDLLDLMSMPLNLPAAHKFALELLTSYLEIVDLPTEQWQAELAKLPVPAKDDRTKTLSRQLLPMVEIFLQEGIRITAQLRLAVLAVGCERYRQEKGQWPTALRELVPMVPPTALTDPYDGQPIRYKKLTDGVLLYSIGTDAEDNNGHRKRPQGFSKGDDITFRLWYPSLRGLPSRSP